MGRWSLSPARNQSTYPQINAPIPRAGPYMGPRRLLTCRDTHLLKYRLHAGPAVPSVSFWTLTKGPGGPIVGLFSVTVVVHMRIYSYNGCDPHSDLAHLETSTRRVMLCITIPSCYDRACSASTLCRLPSSRIFASQFLFERSGLD